MLESCNNSKRRIMVESFYIHAFSYKKRQIINYYG